MIGTIGRGLEGWLPAWIWFLTPTHRPAPCGSCGKPRDRNADAERVDEKLIRDQ